MTQNETETTTEARAEQIADELADVDVVPLVHEDARTVGDQIDTQSHNAFWNAWCDVVEILRDEVAENEDIDAYHEIGNMRESHDQITVRDDDLSVTVSYRHTGSLGMLAENLNDGVVVYEGNVEA